MTKKLMGLFAAAALMGSGMAVAGGEGKKHDKQQTQTQGSTQQDSSIGGSGSQVGQSGQAQGQSGQVGMTDQTQLSGNQITGRVVKSDKKTIWVEHAGAIVPLKVDKNTQFADPTLKRASDIKEGQQIRASFEVRKTDNFATNISMDTGAGMGGSGVDPMLPDQGINKPLDSVPPSDTLPPMNDGTGGSGDLGSDINNPPSSDAKEGKTGDF